MKRQKPLVSMVVLLLAIFMLSPGSATAGRYDGSTSAYQSKKIDHSITPGRIKILESRLGRDDSLAAAARNKIGRFSRQTIFWTGRVSNFITYPQNFWLRIKTGDGDFFWVYAKKTIRNMDFDRTGYKVGVKGNLVQGPDGRVRYLQARSLVILAPPRENAYHRFRVKYKLGENLTFKAVGGEQHLNSPVYPFILHRIYTHNPHYPWEKIKMIAGGIVYYCEKYRVDPLLVTALINVESAFDVDAVSSSGAVGLGQLMPSTASGMGLDPDDPVQNIGGCVRYLSTQLKRWGRYPDREALALASYNAGPGAVSRYGGVPPYSETRNYVFFITFLKEEYLKQMKETPAETVGR